MNFSTPTGNRIYQFFIHNARFPTRQEILVTSYSAYHRGIKEVSIYIWEKITGKIWEE